eukprot:CAMPEP_0172444760 /NCGR_PEP_ID=MMETSP1065-20121228/4776_1 /TAXON_ID=265537 /ORGANISM="Amphiprora paludosa, Strain CCMP125" /LENGTH=298 /DNA_ID=CAMNT_0013195445 /DNA_START=210 /DNA_END=1106 /DNA_ORIENTATION=-
MLRTPPSTHEKDCCATMEALQTEQVGLNSSSSVTAISSMMQALLDTNSVGVGCLRDGKEDEAFLLFEKGLNACGVDIRQLFGNQVEAFLPRLSSKGSKNQPLHHESSDTIYTTSYLQTVDTSTHWAAQPQQQKSQQPIRDTSFELYESALLLGPYGAMPDTYNSTAADENQMMVMFAHHIAPVMLYNLGLLVHKRAVTAADHFLAHELYRVSLYLMEENSMQGMLCKSFDVLLLALFNNLCELNCSFFQKDRVVLCREKFLAVFHRLDQSQICPQDYTFFREQLLFSADLFPTAAAAA